jgi:SAM-dependent methyltransferase
MIELERYVQYFRDVDFTPSGTSICRSTDRGVYLPSNPVHILIGLSCLLEAGAISKSDKFLDAGSGDGRVTIGASLLGLDATGVEYDPHLIALARYHATQINVNPTFLQGDFTSDETFYPGNFTDFGVVYNFINNERDIAAKIANESPVGTKFVLYGHMDDKTLPGLDYQFGFKHHDFKTPVNPISPRIGIFHIYRKLPAKRALAPAARL